jgi:hypothetical protein
MIVRVYSSRSPRESSELAYTFCNQSLEYVSLSLMDQARSMALLSVGHRTEYYVRMYFRVRMRSYLVRYSLKRSGSMHYWYYFAFYLLRTRFLA